MRYTIVIMAVLAVCTVASARNHNIPEATVVPTIDGVMTTGEWSDAVEIFLSDSTKWAYPTTGSIAGAAPTNDADLSGYFYMKWDRNNFYLAIRVYDQSLNWLTAPPGQYNKQDGIQFCFGLNNPPSGGMAGAPCFDFVAETSEATGPDYSIHEVLVLPNVQVDASILADGYIVEVVIPWSDWGDYRGAPGDIHCGGFVLMDSDGTSGVDTYLSDIGMYSFGSIWTGNTSTWNTFTLESAYGCTAELIEDYDLYKDCKIDFKDFALMANNWTESLD